MINVHASLLPRYRGAAPVHRAVIAGDAETGVTIMRVVKALDAGADAREGDAADRPGRDQRRRRARPRATRRARCSSTSSTHIADGTRARDAAGRRAATYAPQADEGRRARSTGRGRRARIHNQVRGLHPWPHASHVLDGAAADPASHRSRDIRVDGTSRTQSRRAPIVEAGRRRDRASPPATAIARASSSSRPKGKRPMTAREFLAGPCRSRPGDARTRSMIAPARVAAYDIAAARSPPAAPTCRRAIARARDASARRARSRAAARSPPAPCAGARPRSPDRARRRGGRSTRLDPEVVDILRLSVYQLLHLDRVPGVGGRRRCGGPDAARRARRSAAGFVNAVLRRQLSRAARCRCPPRRRAERRRTARRRSTTSASRCRIRAGWWRAGSIASASTRPKRWVQFNNAPAPLTLRANTLRTTPDGAGRGVARATASSAEPTAVRAGRARRRRPATRCGRRWPRPVCSSCRTRRRSSSRCSRVAAPGERVLDTCASPGGKTTAMAAAIGRAGLVVACDVRGAAHRPAAAKRWPAPARDQRAPSCRPTCRSRCRSRPGSTASSSTRPAPGSARCGAIPTSAGGAAKPILPRLAAAQLRMLRARRGRGRAGRPARLRDLFERAGGERRRRRPRSSPRSDAVRRRSTRADFAERSPAARARRSSIRPGISGRWPWQHGLEAFFGAVAAFGRPKRCLGTISVLHGLQNPRLERGQAAGARAARSSRPTSCSPPPPCASRCARARCRCPTSTGRTVQRRDGAARRPRADAEGRRRAARRPEDPGRARPRAGSAAGRRPRAASAASRSGSAPGQRAATVPALIGETERTAQLRLQQDGLDARRQSPKSARSDYPGRRRRRAGPAARAPRQRRRAARQPRRARRDAT